MRNWYSLILLILTAGCSQHLELHKDELAPPESNRFTKEVFVTNLYEPTELVVLPDGRILFSQRRGALKIYDPVSAKLDTYDSITVYHEHEDGLMGIALDPGFEQNRWIYVYYSPPGELSVQNLSRFSFTTSGLKNEVIMLQVDVQREECCHTGGSIEFGPGGLLYLSTGDDTNPFDSEGFAPIDDRQGRSAWDARGTSANTNDLRGKILRIKPLPDGSYSIPTGNLFEDNDQRTRPEIYVMGCRNPYRISVDPKNGWLFWGDVGPDAGTKHDVRGPRGHDEFNVALKAGNFGWPLFVADNQAYGDYSFMSGRSAGFFDPNKPVNRSPNNTGIEKLPPAIPAKIYYPYARSSVFPEVKNGGRNAMAGPVYYSDQFDSPNRFPAFFDGRVFFYDWIRGFIFSLALDEKGNPTDWYPFMPETEFNNIIDMAFGPDGQLYTLEYGTGWFTRNENAVLSRITYNPGNRPPKLIAEVSRKNGAVPLEVMFDASGSYDDDRDKLFYRWEIDDDVYNDSIFFYQFEKEGIYYPELILKDQKGNKVRKQFVIEAGNEAPKVKIEVGGNQTFFWKGRKIKYEVEVSDREDGKLDAGIDPSEVVFEIDHFQSSDKAERGHQKVPVNTGLELINSLDCKGCHKPDERSIGPSYLEVAEHYLDDREAVNFLSYKIINGGGGVWGEQMMSAHPDLSNEDAAAIVNYILSMAKSNEYPLRGEFTPQKETGRYLLSASYEDKGKSPLKPISTSEVILLKTSVLEAANFDKSMDTKVKEQGGIAMVSDIYHGAWIAFERIDLTGIQSIGINARGIGGEIVIRSGSPDGEILAQVEAYGSGDYFEASLEASGFHDLYFVFLNLTEKNKLFDITTITFKPDSDEK